MSNIIISILSVGLKPLYDKNIAYYKIIKDFREKLPRQQNQAKKLSTEEIEKSPFLHNSFKYMTVVDTSNHKVGLSEVDIDIFYNKLNDFNYNFVAFSNYYKDFTKNLNRFNPKAENKNFDLVIIQSILKDDPQHPLKPLDVLIYHLKWKYKLTSRVYTRIKYGKDEN